MRLAVCTSLALAAAAAAQGPTSASFAPPVRLKAGDAFLGMNRLFPSPVFHDCNGDGLRDIVIGDLRGHLTVALRRPGTGPAAYGPETKLQDEHGKDIDFHNW